MKCNYTKLDDSESTPLFQVTPGKNCRLFPYLWTPECAAAYQTGMINPQNNPYQCRAMGPVDPGQMYTGLPVNFEYSPAGQAKNCAAPVTGPKEGLSPPLNVRENLLIGCPMCGRSGGCSCHRGKGCGCGGR